MSKAQGIAQSANQSQFKNRIINGNMAIDQRNAGASVTATTSAPYTVDRWACYSNPTSKFTVQQNAGSVTPPTGFTNYLGATSSSAYSSASTDIMVLFQCIEGFNWCDMGWGTANAQSVTLSFWVRSSLTGTFGGSAQNYANTRSYPFSFTISAANTWEQKSITIAGDTTGTWVGASNAGALQLNFDMGSGSGKRTTAGAWASGAYFGTTGATSVVGTSGATFYITGVQLEKGTVATSFDYRPYGTEFMLCQRYLPVFSGTGFIGNGVGASTTAAYVQFPFMVAPRTAPTGVTTSAAGTFQIDDLTAGQTVTSITFNSATNNSALIRFNVASGIAQYRPVMCVFGSSAAYIQCTGCEL